MQDRFVSVRSDDEIIELYWARDEEAIRATDAKYRKYLISISQNILHDMQDSEECLNDTYVGTWNSIPPHRPRLLQSFLASIMRKIATTKYRNKHRQKRSIGATFSLTDFEDFIPDDDSQYTWQETAELGQIISNWLRTLSERQQYIFISRYYYAKPIEQISEELSCSRSTINKEIAAMKQGLRTQLAKEGYIV
ncbi:MAG: RNA polymerase sigma factor [Clostridia bacterium]|nr:RNA polymerase sigma factor [Clostridia bacterium]